MRQESHSNLKSKSSRLLKIGVLYGGASSERTISLRSGRAVHAAIKRLGYPAVWIDPRNSARTAVQLRKVDLAFIALHGRGGEDGVIQKRLESQKIPYIGSDAASSWRAFDKAISKKIFVKAGVPTAPFVLVNARNWKTKLASFPSPFFVKPLQEGSSIGVFSVENFTQEAEKIKHALKQYKELLVEPKITGREFTVGVLDNAALPVVELKPKSSFYDYHSKYTKGMTEYVVPAEISKPFAAKLQKIALKAHRVLGLRDFSRVDIMADENETPYVLEVNSIPGFTELSLLPKAAKAAGLSFEALCERLIDCACKRKK